MPTTRVRFPTDGQECAKARVLAGYNIRQAAEALNVTPAHLSYVERNERNAGPALVKRMAELYDVPAERLIVGLTEPAA